MYHIGPLTETSTLIAKLHLDGWHIARHGIGHHVQFKHAMRPGKITVDIRQPRIPLRTLIGVFEQAGWRA